MGACSGARNSSNAAYVNAYLYMYMWLLVKGSHLSGGLGALLCAAGRVCVCAAGKDRKSRSLPRGGPAGGSTCLFF